MGKGIVSDDLQCEGQIKVNKLMVCRLLHWLHLFKDAGLCVLKFKIELFQLISVQ